MAPAKSKSQADGMKQKSLMGWFSKTPNATTDTPTKPKSALKPDALKFRTPESKGPDARALNSSAARSSRSSDAGESAKDTPPTSDPIDVDMPSAEEDEKERVRSTTTRLKRKIVVEDSDEDMELAAMPRQSRATYRVAPPEDHAGRPKKARVFAILDDDEHGDEEGQGLDQVVSSFTKRLTHFRKSSGQAHSRSSSVANDNDLALPSDSDISTQRRSSSRSSRRSSTHTDEDEFSELQFDDDDDDDDNDVPQKKSIPAKRPAPKKRQTEGRGSSSLSFLTAAEKREQGKKDVKKAAEDPYAFLGDIRDKDGVRPGEPGYDPRTLYIPKKAWTDFTPFEKQFWEIKQTHFDTILFFQKGKFLELYEDDARVGHQEFDLKLTQRVKMSMVGVPESSFNFWAAKFLGKGYKVGRVDQAETALGAEMRLAADKIKGKPKNVDKGKDKIVRRELNKVYTNGTLVDEELLTDEQAGHCISIREEEENTKKGVLSSFGVCVLDSSTSEFNLSAFVDDVCRTKLETLIRQLRVKEIVFTKGNLTVPTMRLLKSILPGNCLWTSLRDVEGFGYDETVTELKAMYCPDTNEKIEDGDGFILGEEVPESIRNMLGNKPSIEALGSMIWYLRQLNIDKEIMSMKNFNVYDPMKRGQGMVLDGQTLAHIEVLLNSEGTEEGSLLKLLSRCITPFGKRLFRIWLCVPLREVTDINSRLDAVQNILAHPTFEKQFTDLAKGLPDLERIVSRIHAKNCKVKDFLRVLTSFKRLSKGLADLAESSKEFESHTIFGLLRSAPDLMPNINNVEAMFQPGKDMTELLPEEGKDEDCDKIMAEISQLEEEFDDELKKLEKTLECKLTYWHSAQGNKEIYLVQTKPNQKNIPSNWTKSGGTKAAARWIVPSLQSKVRKLKEARENRSTAIKSFKLRVFAEFDVDRSVWLRAIRVLAELDCLFSLAKSSSALGEPVCRPEFFEGDEAWVDFEELRHPALCARPGLKDFIPNNVKLGREVGRIALLTGPNMGGKSTVMRMTAAGIIMAQLGMLVPAKSARLCPVDAILTRMGAYDNMFSNASTFKVELDECCKIIRNATPKSFVILDELGRGTSTYDGMAIAGAVLHQIATHTLALSFFATHYGSLTDDYAYHPNIRNMHMATLVDDDKFELVFLYKLIDGVATGSFGTHVANLAGVPMEVVKRAEVVSEDFARKFKERLEGKQKKAATSRLPLVAQADFAYLYGLATGSIEMPTDEVRRRVVLKGLKETVIRYISQSRV